MATDHDDPLVMHCSLQGKKCIVFNSDQSGEMRIAFSASEADVALRLARLTEKALIVTFHLANLKSARRNP